MKLWQTCFVLALLLSESLSTLFTARDIPVIYLNRRPRSLLNTFPFNQRQQDHDHAHDEHHHHEELPASDNKQIRQGDPAPANDLTISNIANANEKCVEKVMMIEEVQYEDGLECHHSYDKRCHTTYTTDYEPQQVEVCDENFVKECFIEYKQAASNETIQICNERPVRACEKDGPIVCETVYESECETHYHIHEVEDDTPDCKVVLEEKCHDVTQGYTTKQECSKWPKQVCSLSKSNVKKYSPETQCKKKPREVCGPGPCPIIAGPKECREDVKTVVQDVPEETCHLRAQPYCKHVTKLVPVLKPNDNCVDVPREVCVRVRTNPKTVKRPVIKKWCYVPTEESGLARSAKSNTDLAPALPDGVVEDVDAEGASLSTLAPEQEVGLTEETTSAN